MDLKILIVDDCQDIADVLAMLIQLEGHITCVAYGGIAALIEAERFVPHVVLLDIEMPDMDGHAVARTLRQTLAGTVYLIAHSARNSAHDVAKAYAAGFDRHLAKPVDEAILFALLRDRQGLLTA